VRVEKGRCDVIMRVISGGGVWNILSVDDSKRRIVNVFVGFHGVEVILEVFDGFLDRFDDSLVDFEPI